LVGDVERALVSRPGIIATESAAKSSNSFFLIHKQLRFTARIGKGYRILVFIEITILAYEAPLPEMHKSPPRNGGGFRTCNRECCNFETQKKFRVPDNFYTLTSGTATGTTTHAF